MRLNSKFRRRRDGKVYEVVDYTSVIVFLSDGSEFVITISKVFFDKEYVEVN